MKENIKIAKELVKVAKTLVGGYFTTDDFDEKYAKEINWLKKAGFKKSREGRYELDFGSFMFRVALPWKGNDYTFYAYCYSKITGGSESEGNELIRVIRNVVDDLRIKLAGHKEEIQKNYDKAIKPYKDSLQELDNFARKF